jgi:protein-disulfide isomerase
LIHRSIRLSSAAALAVLALVIEAPAFTASAQEHVPPAPATPGAQAPAGQPVTEPAAPAPAAAPKFPAPDPSNFTAASPTKEAVDAFLKANWGYDENRVWQVQAILKTPVEGVSKVVVYVADRASKDQQGQAIGFFVLPDGKHIITGDEVIDFGDHPFADVRQKMEQRADGPYRGTASKDLEMVEFADFQCPHCKAAQANMDKLAADFPKARVVFQNYPIASHPEALSAAEYGNCVTKLGGSTAFFQYSAAVFDGQDGLATPDGATLTLNSAVTKAGLDPAKISTCAADPQVKAQVEASLKLATDVGIASVPTLVVNGREISIGQIPYDLLKKIVDYQAKLDGISQ